MPDVHIQEVAVSLRTIDGESVLTPALMAQIVSAVIEVLEKRDRGRQRLQRDTRTASDDMESP